MTASDVRAVIHQELAAHGFPGLAESTELDLISAGVNSAALIQILSALEDRFDIELDLEPLFAEPATVGRIEAEITRIARLPRPSA